MENRYQSVVMFQRRLLVAFWSLLALAITHSAHSQNQARSIKLSNSSIGYLEHLPKDYHQSGENYPVMIFLHGIGERGNGTSDLHKVKKNGPPMHVEQGHDMSFTVNGKQESFIVVSPQLRADYNSWPAFYVDYVVEHVKKTYRIDTDRIYLTGLSLGGGGCWTYASYKAEYANKIAAIVPICGAQSYKSNQVGNLVNGNVKVWALHGDADRVVPVRYSQDWVSNINRLAPGLADLTIYPGAGHGGAWYYGFNPTHLYHSPNPYEWLLQQSRGSTSTPEPTPTPTPANQTPIAKAGADVSVQLPVAQIVLDGGDSRDSDGSIASYAWKQINGSTAISLSGQNSQKLTITDVLAGDYTFELQVKDNQGATATDRVSVAVAAEPTAPAPNPTPSADCNCDHVITPANSYVNGQSLGVKPGDVVCVKAGQYDYLNLFNFQGSANAPITIKNCGGQVRIGNSSVNYGIVMNNNRYVHFTGTGSSDQYGFKVDGGSRYLASGFGASGKSSDFTLDHIEITKVEAGVLAKTSPTCDASTWRENFTMRNVKFHDFYIHDIKGEGFYIGHTSFKVTMKCDGMSREVEPHRIENLRVYNNRIENAGWDGIQVAQASSNCEIYDNHVYNYGTANMSSQQGGILVGGNTTGKVYNNWVEKGTGSGIQVFGTGTITVYNNVVLDAGEDAIFVDDRSPSPMDVRFINNTIVNPKRDGIRLYNDQAANNLICNNLVVSPGSLGNYSNSSTAYLFVGNGVEVSKMTNHFSATVGSVDFEDHANDEFQLDEGSPAINQGTNVSQYGIVEDLEGNERPANGAYDIGAFEAVLDTTPTPEPTPEPTPVPSDKVAGLNYSYYEGSWSVLPKFADLKAVKTGTVTNFDLSVREQDSNFGVVFAGYINIPATGEYTFVTGSDDGSKLFIDGQLVVNNDGLHGLREQEGTVTLTEGLHPIMVSYFERSGSEKLNVYWKNTAHGVTAAQQIPDEVLVRDNKEEEETPTEDSKGLNYSYYEGSWSVLPKFADLKAVKTGTVTNFDLSVREQDSNFGVVFAGYINIPATGEYTFVTGSDDGSKLFIDGQLVVNNDGLHGLREQEGTVTLTEGLHPIMVSYFERSGSEKLNVYWKNTAHGVTVAQQIPDEVLVRDNKEEEAPEETPAPPVSGRIFQINATKASNTGALEDWYNIALDGFSGTRTFTNVTDREGKASNWSITAYNGVERSSIIGVADNQNTLAGGVYPSEVLRHAAYTTGSATITLSNLSQNNVYNVTVHGGRTGSGSKVTNYVVNGVSKSLQCINNEDQVITFEGVSPDAQGSIAIKFQQGGNTWGYLNAIVVEEIDSSNVRAAGAIAGKLMTEDELASSENAPLVVNVYPNPFAERFTLDLSDYQDEEVTVTLFDQLGNVLMTETRQRPGSGATWQEELRPALTHSGVHVLRVQSASRGAQMARIVSK